MMLRYTYRDSAPFTCQWFAAHLPKTLLVKKKGRSPNNCYGFGSQPASRSALAISARMILRKVLLNSL
jgi:hypothetical protein